MTASCAAPAARIRITAANCGSAPRRVKIVRTESKVPRTMSTIGKCTTAGWSGSGISIITYAFACKAFRDLREVSRAGVAGVQELQELQNGNAGQPQEAESEILKTPLERSIAERLFCNS